MRVIDLDELHVKVVSVNDPRSKPRWFHLHQVSRFLQPLSCPPGASFHIEESEETAEDTVGYNHMLSTNHKNDQDDQISGPIEEGEMAKLDNNGQTPNANGTNTAQAE